MTDDSFPARLAALRDRLSPAEARVAGWLAENRETMLFAPAAEIARGAATSDATVVRTARKLGYGGLEALRRAMAAELRRDLTLADRMARDLADVPRENALAVSTAALREALAAIDALGAEDIRRATEAMAAARRIHVFGIGPSGFIAGYFAAQLARLGLDARAVTRTGLQFADDLVGIGTGDMVVALAYDRAYPEIRALFDRAEELELASVLVTAQGPVLPDSRAGLVLRVPRGRPGGVGLHAGTVALLEGLLMVLSAADPDRARAALEAVNAWRSALAGGGMEL
ncbi:MurR/RpiR family transcriptional regulator [Poseidonocella sp. HB161398]|uniref:MurR/RpiR family transcriptional regulator n=1 Tax=Poseidonocella sp. HB161398 TaxID=2320855 RepID=UPI0014869EC4|nr:MurR/RpiR family transcriptional regulator [Poseidonocella sp. HB161398]